MVSILLGNCISLANSIFRNSFFNVSIDVRVLWGILRCTVGATLRDVGRGASSAWWDWYAWFLAGTTIGGRWGWDGVCEWLFRARVWAAWASLPELGGWISRGSGCRELERWWKEGIRWGWFLAPDERTDGDGKISTELLWPFWMGAVFRPMGTLRLCVPSLFPFGAAKGSGGWKVVGEIWECAETWDGFAAILGLLDGDLEDYQSGKDI